MSMNRRHFLTAAGTTGAMVLAAGCAAYAEGTPAESHTDTATQTDGGTPTPTTGTGRPSSDSDRHVSVGQTVTVGDTRVTVENPRVRKAVVSSGMAHTRVVADAGQFVVVDVLIDGDHPEGNPATLDFWSSVYGEQLAGSDPLAVRGSSPSYAFPFPAKQHDSVAILHRTAETRVYWSLPKTVRETLALEPKFAVPDLQVQPRDGILALDMTITNDGDRDGQFLARVSLEGFSGGTILDIPVAAGETHHYTGRPGDILTYLENQGGGTLTVHYPADEGLKSISRDVEPSQLTIE